jgi:hypothetical protein
VLKKRSWGRLSFFLVLWALFFGCADGDDKEAIRALIQQGVDLAESQEIGDLMDLTTDDFIAGPGDMGRRETKRILWLAFRHYKSFKVLYPRPDVDLEEGASRASSSFPFLIVKKEKSFPKLNELYDDPKKWLGAVGERADLYRLQIELTKQGGDWLVQKAHLARFTGVGFSD